MASGPITLVVLVMARFLVVVSDSLGGWRTRGFAGFAGGFRVGQGRRRADSVVLFFVFVDYIHRAPIRRLIFRTLLLFAASCLAGGLGLALVLLALTRPAVAAMAASSAPFDGQLQGSEFGAQGWQLVGTRWVAAELCCPGCSYANDEDCCCAVVGPSVLDSPAQGPD